MKIQDEESWLEAIKSSKYLHIGGAWYTLEYEDGSKEKFQKPSWVKKLQDDKFRNRILQLMEQEVILKFEKKEVDAKEFYDIDGEDE